MLIERKNRFAKNSRPEKSPIEKAFFRLTSVKTTDFLLVNFVRVRFLVERLRIRRRFGR